MPNSFVYRFIPKDTPDLTQGGTIQALQVLIAGQPITFDDGGRREPRSVPHAAHLRHHAEDEVDHADDHHQRDRGPGPDAPLSPRA